MKIDQTNIKVIEETTVFEHKDYIIHNVGGFNKNVKYTITSKFTID